MTTENHEHELVAVPKDQLVLCSQCQLPHWLTLKQQVVVGMVGIEGEAMRVLVLCDKERADSEAPLEPEEIYKVLGMAQTLFDRFIAPEDMRVIVTMIPVVTVDLAEHIVLAKMLSDAAENN